MNELHPSLDRWSEWFDGLGSAAGRAELERHLAACTECRGQVDTFKRLREDLQGLQVKTAPSYLRRQIMDAAREREIRQSTSFGRSWLWGLPLASIASVLIVGFVFRMQQDSPRLPASPVVAVELAMPSSDSDVHIAPRPDAKPSAGPTFKTAVSGIRAQDVPFAAERRTPPAGGGLINRSFSGSARGRAFDIAGPVADPVVFHHVWPVMPAWVAREKFRGEVLLSFVLQRDGTVGTDVRIERSCGNLDLDQLAVAAFQQWRFAPPQPGTPAKRERARISIPPPPQ